MPTISVDKADFYRRIGSEYTTEEFDELCFDFGVELDEDTTADVEAARKAGLPTEAPQLKIEIPANRYDLLCSEGLARSLRVFLGREAPTSYTLAKPTQEAFIEPSTSPLRPYFAAAVLRLARPMNDLEYNSFIDLQDKLHHNLCRQRKFVAIGTHDLDTIEGPFRYMCRDPHQIKFAPLNKDTEYTAAQLMELYDSDRHLSKYLPIIRDAPGYPIIYDKHDRVLSMPPVINSQHSKIVAGKTTNIFVDVTATDKTKLDIVVMLMATMFAEYCKVPFEVEPVKIHYPDGTTTLTPNVAPRKTTASHAYINAAAGLDLSTEEWAGLLTKMSLAATVSEADHDVLDVLVPCTRPDILHECDIMEDAAIAYGYNNLPTSMEGSATVAKPTPVNKLGDILRKECAMAGWTECLPYILCSHDENYAWLLRKDPGGECIRLANPKTTEFQVVRTSLVPGLLKTARENKAVPFPLKVFEVSDVAFQRPELDRRSRNERHLGAVYINHKAGFEVVHGLLDRIMQILGVPYIATADSKAEYGYYIAEAKDEPSFLPGRAAHVFLRPRQKSQKKGGPLETAASALKAALPGQDIKLGQLGILHPEVLANFDLTRPASTLEINIEPLL
ncbi:hypothetical protein CcaverHIS002_0704820 [Cutaneotrichosporon cavernicola]|nr:hypothetical protein CcaverHIS002_0704820 [Cutaneotrichosporon cavernicola]